jgi:hypothetical protein
MGLDLNDEIMLYQEFYGRNTKQIPLLIADGRTPLHVAGVLAQRLNSGKSNWKYNYFDTGDGLVYHPDKKVKVVLDAQPLRELTSESRLHNGAFVLEDGVYETLEGEELTFDDIKDVVGRELSLKEAQQHPLWRAFARNQDLLDEYAQKMFAEMKERFDYDKNMGVYLDSFDRAPKMRAACVDWLEDRSWLGGVNNLDYNYGRLVGYLAPKAPGAPVKPREHADLEGSVQTALDGKRAFEHNGTVYVPVSDSTIQLGK